MKQNQQTIRSVMEQAMALHQQGNAAKAEAMYREVLKVEPNEPNAWHLLGVAAWQRNDLLMAEENIRKAIRIHGKVSAYYNNLAGVLRQRSANDEALECYEQSLKLDPKDGVAQKELAQMMHQRGLDMAKEQRWDEAQKAYRRVLEIDPNNVATLNNLASALQHLDGREEAIQLYTRAIAAMPNNNLMLHYNRATCYLTDAKLSEGWADFRTSQSYWRAIGDKRQNLPWLSLPMWDGSDPKGKRILVWGDHGIGDEILFGGLIPELVARGAKVAFECMDRLVPLMKRSFPEITVVPRQDPPLIGSDFDCYAPCLWLACVLRPTLEGFPDRKSFLVTDPDKTALLRQRYKNFGKKHVVGISWFSLSSIWGVRRSIPLPEILQALPLEDILVVDLQYGDTADAWRQAKQYFPKLAIVHDNEVDQFKDMDMYAAQVAACDSIITICNTTSHVAGALGVPTSVLMSELGLTWYWFANMEKCPWYPSLRLLWPNTPNRLQKAVEIIEKSEG
ncbi:MAG TPA: tetratricopeptide repeat protein [Alphaproteobacteria bacterium]|nr:tetratricopeptide repeat protein [Alphaproteobacteria bacterium]